MEKDIIEERYEKIKKIKDDTDFWTNAATNINKTKQVITDLVFDKNENEKGILPDPDYYGVFNVDVDQF